MAAEKRTSSRPEATLRNSGLGIVRSGLLSLLAVQGLGVLHLTSGATIRTATAIAIASSPPPSPPSPPPSSTRSTITKPCRAHILYPKGPRLEFYHRDTLNVTYRSSFANPTLHCWCSHPGTTKVTEHFRVENATPRDGSVLVPLSFPFTGSCWFDLRSDDALDCQGRSDTFAFSSKQRHLGRALPTIGLDSPPPPTLAPRATSTTSSPTPSNSAAQTSPSKVVITQKPQSGGGEDLGTGGRVGLAIGITLVCLGVIAMAAFLYFRRRKKHEDNSLAGAIIDHDRRNGRKGPEKSPPRHFAPSVHSGHSDEPLYPVQPVFDGYPGSTGYDDLRSIESSTQGHSPTLPHSPTFGQNNTPWSAPEHHSSGRDELAAARLNSNSASVITSYGPNPVTPTLTPRPSSRIALNVRAGNVSVDSREDIPPMPGISIMPEYITFGASKSIPRLETYSTPSPPRKAAPPIVVSYGPNRVTPTPAVTTPTVPMDDAIVKRRVQGVQGTAAIRSTPLHLEHQDSWEEEDEPMMAASTMGPLPPYASTEEYDAMEKGAIRKLAEPEAYELPPTKDGFYHYQTDIVEYELPGAAPQRAPQLPYDPYRQRMAEGPSAGPSNGRSGGWRDIDEQKFMLSDVEIAKLKAEKAKVRAKMAAAAEEQKKRQQEREQREREQEQESYPLEERPAASSATTR